MTAGPTAEQERSVLRLLRDRQRQSVGNPEGGDKEYEVWEDHKFLDWISRAQARMLVKAGKASYINDGGGYGINVISRDILGDLT